MVNYLERNRLLKAVFAGLLIVILAACIAEVNKPEPLNPESVTQTGGMTFATVPPPTPTATPDIPATASALGLVGVEQITKQDDWLVYTNKEGGVVAVQLADGELRVLDNGFASSSDGTIQEWKGRRFERVTLPPEIPPELAGEVELKLSETDHTPVVHHKGLDIDYLERRDGVWQLKPFDYVLNPEMSAVQSERSKSYRTKYVHVKDSEFIYSYLLNAYFGGLSYNRDANGKNVSTVRVHYKGKWFDMQADYLEIPEDVSRFGNPDTDIITQGNSGITAMTKILNLIYIKVPSGFDGLSAGWGTPRKGIPKNTMCISMGFRHKDIQAKCEDIFQQPGGSPDLNENFLYPYLTSEYDPNETMNLPLMEINVEIISSVQFY